ncbi:MAG: NUDIX hydrolase [Pseudomonadales bacterium]|nr:NUDIX hydrolase [Pseudomonadales bacterium]
MSKLPQDSSQQVSPWRTLSKTKIYDNPWISVTEHQVTDPSGNPGIYGLVHMKNYAIGIIPIDDQGNTWLIGQYRYALGKYFWEIPMGGSPVGESPLNGAKRELKEEAGITANHWELLMELHTSNSVTDEYAQVFVAKDLQFCETNHESTEQLKVYKLPLAEAIEMAMEGGITDAISVAALLRVKLMGDR